MANLPISGLDLITASAIATNDRFVLLDVSATTGLAAGPAGKDCGLTADELRTFTGYNYRGLATTGMIINRWDMVIHQGRRVVYTATAPLTYAGFISGASMTPLDDIGHIKASSFGLVCDGNPASATANSIALQAALNAANPTGANGVGGVVELPYGNFFTNVKIFIPNGVLLVGNNTFGTYWSLATGSNCDMVGPYKYLGSGPPNAFYWGMRDLSMDARQSQQGTSVTNVSITNGSTTVSHATRAWLNDEYLSGSGLQSDTKIVAGSQAGTGPFTATMTLPAVQTLTDLTVYCGITSPIYAVNAQPNPLNTLGAGDWGFDPSGLIFNVVVKNARNAAFANFGRSANVYLRCKTSASLGIGFIGSFDSRYLSCESDFSHWHGFDFRGSSEQIANCKSYNSGQVKTSATAANEQSHGYLFNGFSGFGGIAIAGCDAQQNTGDAFHLISCTSVALAGNTASQIGFGSAVTTNVGYYLDNCNNCTIVGTCGVQPSNHCYALVNGSTENFLATGFSGASKGTAALAGSSDTGNCVIISGVAINFPGLVSSATVAMAYRKRHSIATSSGSHHNIGVSGTQGTAVLNRLELVPFWPERGAAQTITEITFRVGGTGVATAVTRQGIFSSDLNGGNVFTVEQELPATVDTSVANAVKQTSLTTPITVDPTKMYWVGSVPQVALGTYQTSYGDFLAGSTSNPTGGYCYTQNSVSGALANITWGTVSGPIQLGGGISVGVTMTG